jgi:hypothetical protein
MPRAASPELRRLRHDYGWPSRHAVWGEVAAIPGELELAKRDRRPAVGLGVEGILTEYAVGPELTLAAEVVALWAFRAG